MISHRMLILHFVEGRMYACDWLAAMHSNLEVVVVITKDN